MGSTYERSFAKACIWELISFLLILLAIYILYGDLDYSFRLSLILTLIKIPLFFIHERVWKSVKWGKIKDGV